MGAWPMKRVNFSVNAEREMPASCASRSSVQSNAGSRCKCRERASYGRISRACQPARAALGQREQIATQHFGEQHLGQVREDHVAARRRGRGLRHRVPQHVVQPFAGRIRADVHAHHARQAREHRLEQLAVAGEIATHQAGRLTTAAKARELDAGRVHNAGSASSPLIGLPPTPAPISCASPCGIITMSPAASGVVS